MTKVKELPAPPFTVPASSLTPNDVVMFAGVPGSPPLPDMEVELYVVTVVNPATLLFQGVNVKTKVPIAWLPTDLVKPIPALKPKAAELLGLVV